MTVEIILFISMLGILVAWVFIGCQLYRLRTELTTNDQELVELRIRRDQLLAEKSQLLRMRRNSI